MVKPESDVKALVFELAVCSIRHLQKNSLIVHEISRMAASNYCLLLCVLLFIVSSSIVVYGLFRALQHLHDNNLVHRDLKIDNMVLSCENTLKLIDFGETRDVGFCGHNNAENYGDPMLTTAVPSSTDSDVFCGILHMIAVEYVCC
jgi:serine/threonine protein kinase